MSEKGGLTSIETPRQVDKMNRWLILVLALGVAMPSGASGQDRCIEGNCVNGQGTMIYDTGHKFRGHFLDGMRHGKGFMEMPGARTLEGVWEYNEIKEGTYTYSDGSQYIGQWQFRERNGQGTLIYADGRKYVGGFKSGRRHGKGTLYYPDGRVYVGDFQDGERTGQGTMTYPDGRKYIGEFKDGERSGPGALIYPDGRKQEGEFRDGEYVGRGQD